ADVKAKRGLRQRRLVLLETRPGYLASVRPFALHHPLIEPFEEGNTGEIWSHDRGRELEKSYVLLLEILCLVLQWLGEIDEFLVWREIPFLDHSRSGNFEVHSAEKLLVEGSFLCLH